jgi:hypothetical protein
MAYRQFDQPNTPEIPKTPEYGLYNQAFLQAMSNQNQRAENEKQRANAKNIAEIKKPSFKISSAESPFSKDMDVIGSRINVMLDPSVDDNTKSYLDQQNLQDVAKAKAQLKALNALEKSVVDVEQKYGKNAKTKVFRDYFSDIYTNSTVANRDEKLAKAAEILAMPEEYVDGDGVVMDYFNTIKPVNPTYESSKERGLRTDVNKSIAHTRFPIDGDPALDSNGQQLMNNGVPVYKKRIANNPRELLGYANSYLENNQEYSDILHKQTAKKYKADFDKEVANWANTFDTPPSEEEKDSFMKGLVANKTRNDIAEKFYKNDKAYIDATSKESYQQPTESQQKKSEAKKNLKNIGGSTTNVSGTVLTPSKNVKSEYDSSLGKASDSNRINSMLFQKDKNGNFTDIDAQTFSLSGDITDETTGEKFKITENEPAVAKNVYPVLERYNDKTDKWVRVKFEPKQGNEEFEANLNYYGKKGIPVRVSMQGDINISTKQNKTGTMMPEEMQELNTLQNIKERDDAQNARLGVLEGKLAKELGRTVRVNMEDSGILKQVTGFDNMEEVAKNASTPEIKKIAENNIKWKKLAESYNAKNPTATKPKTETTQPKQTTTKGKGTSVPTNPNIKLSLIDQIKKEMPNATPEEWVAEYKKRSK